MAATYMLFPVILTVLVTISLATLPERRCSLSVTLETSDLDHSTFSSDDIDTADVFNSLSVFLEPYNTLVSTGDCLEVKLHAGNYTLTDYNSALTYSLVLRAVEGAVTISCQQSDKTVETGSPFCFQRYSAQTSHISPGTGEGTDKDGEFFVQIEGVHFEKCQRPLQFDAMDYVGIANCSFSYFISSAVDIFNCQHVQVESSLFCNNSAMLGKDQYHSNSGGLGIAYHTNHTFYFNQFLIPWVRVTDCRFEYNKVELPGANTQQQINQAINEHFYFGRGGGLGIFLDEFFINITVDIEHCLFKSNFADSFGGGLYLYIDGTDTQHEFKVSHCNFTDNQAGLGSFGGGLQVALLIHNAQSEPSQLDFMHCHFVGNQASFGGGLSAVQVYSQGSGNRLSLRNSHFEENFASDVGSAVMFASLLYVQNRKSSYFYQVSDNVFLKNVSPGGTFSAGFIPQNITGHNQFLKNTGPGLRSVGSQIAVQGNLSFIGNNAEGYKGGAVYISAFGQLKLYRGTNIDFVDNVGRIGSAIVVDVQRSSQVFSELIFNTQCFLIFEDATTAPDQWDQVAVRFSGNRAVVAPVVYTSHLSLCSWFSANIDPNSNLVQATFSATNFTQWPVFDYSSRDNVATSQPNGSLPTFYFQTEATQVSSSSISSEEMIEVRPGQEIEVSLVGLDQFQLPTYLIARVSDIRADINTGAFSQSTDSDIVERMHAGVFVNFEPALIPITPKDPSAKVLYRVYASTLQQVENEGNITVVVDTPYNVIDSEQFIFKLKYAHCLPGYKLKSRVDGDEILTCTCQDSLSYVLACNERKNVIYLRDGLWASTEVTSNTRHLRVQVCPTPFCHCSDENGITCDSLYYHDDPNANKQCHTLREGTLCGQCVNGTSVGVLRFNCRACDSRNYWALGFLVVGDVLVCVGILVALVKLHYTFPHSMKGLLFYIQTVYYTTGYFPTSFWNARKYMLYLGSTLGLYFPWDFCLFPDMSALASYPIRFIPPFIATIVTVAAIISVFCCFEKRAQKRIWHGVWAFTLLMYAPLVHTCVSLLHCPSIPPAHGGEVRPRWFLDGEVVCFGDRGHTLLAVTAILILLFLCILPPSIFIFTIVIYSPPSVKTKYPLVERLHNAVTVGYMGRARWYGAWDLARRFLLIGVVTALPGRSVSALYVVIPALALHLYIWPYLKWWQNLLETLILANYSLLHLLRSTQTILDDLTSYSGTTVPASGLTDSDRLTLFFSLWYYLPLVIGATTILVITCRVLVMYVRLRWKRRRSKSSFEVTDVGYHRYPEGNETVTISHVSID